MQTKRFFKPKETKSEGQVSPTKGKLADELAVEHQKVKEERAILAWKSAARPFRRKSKQYFTTVAIIALVLIIVSALLQWWMAIGVILTLIFVIYVLGTVEPEEIEHKISKSGLSTGGKVYLWEELKSFWFENHNGRELLVVETKKAFPSRLYFLLGSIARPPVVQILKEHLTLRAEPPVDWIDKLAKTVAEKIPLED